MTKTKPASLVGVFAAKGAAKPADATKPIDPPVASPSAAVLLPAIPTEQAISADQMTQVPAAVIEMPSLSNMPMATKSLTVKVDVTTYGKLKAHGGALGGKTNQDIFIEALGLYFKKYGIN